MKPADCGQKRLNMLIISSPSHASPDLNKTMSKDKWQF